MTMPKATINEYGQLSTEENEIGFAREALSVQTIA
jgi:hypothetical protein